MDRVAANSPDRRAPLLAPGVRPGEVLAWALYDFANSGYTTVVITAVYNAYFVGVVAGKASGVPCAWTMALPICSALVLVPAPVLGAYAALRAAKKLLLAAPPAGCVLFTAALALTGAETLALAIALVIASNFCFSTGENLVA